MRRFVPIAVSMALLAGCDDVATVPTEIALPSTAAAEPSWNEQIAAVREGTSTEIRTAAPVTPKQFRDLADGCDGLTALVLDQAALGNDDLDVLPELPRLRWIKLPFVVNDDGAAAIGRCEALEIVNLPDTSITDAGLARIADLPRLELLRVRSPNVTDAGLRELERLPRLRFLHLLDAPITDAGLKSVAAIETLESFYLDGETRTTDAGLRTLLSERPDLHFHKDQYHIPGDPNAHPHE